MSQRKKLQVLYRCKNVARSDCAGPESAKITTDGDILKFIRPFKKKFERYNKCFGQALAMSGQFVGPKAQGLARHSQACQDMTRVRNKSRRVRKNIVRWEGVRNKGGQNNKTKKAPILLTC